MIRLVDIDPDNWRLGLQVAEHQRKFVSSAPWLLARAYGYRNYRSNAFVIYDDETPVGMGLYYENINENFKEKILNPSLKFHNKTVEQFNADVKKLDDDMRAYFEQCEKEMKSMSKGDKNEDLF